MYQNLIMVLIPFIAGGIVWLLERARIRVEKRQIEEILRILYEIIFEAEKKGISGEDKRDIALRLAKKRLSDRQIELIKRDKGSLVSAIQFVFERFANPFIEKKKIVRLLEEISKSVKSEQLSVNYAE